MTRTEEKERDIREFRARRATSPPTSTKWTRTHSAPSMKDSFAKEKREISLRVIMGTDI